MEWSPVEWSGVEWSSAWKAHIEDYATAALKRTYNLSSVFNRAQQVVALTSKRPTTGARRNVNPKEGHVIHNSLTSHPIARVGRSWSH